MVSVKKLLLKHSEHSSPVSQLSLAIHNKKSELFKSDFEDINKHVAYFEPMLRQATTLANKSCKNHWEKVLSHQLLLKHRHLLMLNNSTEVETLYKLMPNKLLPNRISFTCDVF